jgi:hypothetical protein
MRLLSAFLILLAAASLSVANQANDDVNKNLYRVQKIYVGDMGNSDEAARFRLLLSSALSKKGFTAVDKAGTADAILTGILSVRVLDERAQALATIQLKSPEGEIIWSGDFTAHRKLIPGIRPRKEPVETRAEDIANRLRDDWKKSAKAAGIKVDK